MWVFVDAEGDGVVCCFDSEIEWREREEDVNIGVWGERGRWD
jgi:hypothetical protein